MSNPEEFNCYTVQSSTQDAILRPWPKCGLVDPPNSIIANVTIKGDCDPVGGEATYNGAVFSRASSNLADGYVFGGDDRVSVLFWHGGITANRYDTSNGIFDASFKCIPYASDGGSCSYDYMANKWNFSGGISCYTPTGPNKKCVQTIEIIGLT